MRDFWRRPNRKVLIALVLAAVLAGTILINPALLNLRASPPDHQRDSGPAFYSFLDKDTMETELRLTSYDGRTNQSLPDPVAIYSVRMVPVESRGHCRESDVSAVLRNDPAGQRFQPRIITRITPPLSLAEFKLTADYVGRHACFKVRMSDESGTRRSYFHASLRPIAKPLLTFDHSFYRDSPEDQVLAHLQLFSYNGQSSHFMPAEATAAVVQRKRIRNKADCTESANSVYVANLNPRPLVRLISPGDELLVNPEVAPRLLYVCYTILLDPDGDSRDWYTYHYASPKIPNYPLSGEYLQTFSLESALQLFRRYLTAEGLEVVEDVDFEMHENGCINKQPEDYVGGCWVVAANRIYISEYYLPEPDHYREATYLGKVLYVQKILSILTHEFLHAASDNVGEFKTKLQRCQHPFETVGYYEKLPAAAEACLHEDPAWGAVTKALKQIYETTDDKSSLPRTTQSRGEPELFSASWYFEFYAGLATYDIDLPEVLEDHYNLYLRDRRGFASLITEDLPLHLRLQNEMRAN